MTETELFRITESVSWRLTAPYLMHKHMRTVMCLVTLSSLSPSGGWWSKATKCCNSLWDKVLSCALSDLVFRNRWNICFFPWGLHCWILVPVHTPPWPDSVLFLRELVKKYLLSVYYVLDMVICSEDKLMSLTDKSLPPCILESRMMRSALVLRYFSECVSVHFHTE